MKRRLCAFSLGIVIFASMLSPPFYSNHVVKASDSDITTPVTINGQTYTAKLSNYNATTDSYDITVIASDCNTGDKLHYNSEKQEDSKINDEFTFL